MIHDRLIFRGLTDKELLRQTTHSKKTSIFERSAPALASITERGQALETKQLPFPTFVFVTKGHFYGHSHQSNIWRAWKAHSDLWAHLPVNKLSQKL